MKRGELTVLFLSDVAWAKMGPFFWGWGGWVVVGGGGISEDVLIGKRRKTQIRRKCIKMLLKSYNLIFNISTIFERDAERTLPRADIQS